ncbi:MAG: endolytic transglycosylase MltG [Deltaproteobacteria bacterium]|nr:endolytic transglycosylase MltG [Deltaproteobacteria bacterium]
MPTIKRIVKAAGGRRRKAGLLLGVIFLLTVLAFWRYAVSPVNPSLADPAVDVLIPKGSGFFRITEILDDAGLVENRPFFWLLALEKSAVRHIRAGEYEFTGAMSPAAIMTKLVKGEIKSYTVTLPEDITIGETADRLAAFKLIDEEEFLALARDRVFLKSLGIEADSAEGYLFPDTYTLDRSLSTREIFRILVKQFWKKITPEMVRRAEAMGLTLHEWVTLASMIGKESGNREEKPLISAVFHNRLKLKMKLQSDPTAVYGLEQNGAPVKTVLRSHLAADRPYNTYRIAGLPPGPIANPGIDSLQAALSPAPVAYLYFVATNNGGHHFSDNLAAHNRAVSKYRLKTLN